MTTVDPPGEEWLADREAREIFPVEVMAFDEEKAYFVLGGPETYWAYRSDIFPTWREAWASLKENASRREAP
jgi:hypothetical protein